MPSLAELISSAQPDRSLLMSYGFSSTTFETMLLRSMQRRGDGEVTILLDPRGVASTFAESAFARGPGVYYRLHPIPLQQASFHCKLYLALRDREATLWVTSANLTPSGLYDNAEVIDELRLHADGSGDVEAWYDYLDLLYTISGRRESLSQEVLASLRRIERWFENRLGQVPTPAEGGSRLLHSGTEAILHQLLRLVPAAEVLEIIAASPFYDAGCRAIREIANVFPNAKLTLLTRGEERDQIDGAALRSLSDRVRVHAFREAEGHRRLHGKAVELRTRDAAWVLVGSANLSRRAWMLSVPDGGNMEAMTLRRVPLHRGGHPLFQDTIGEEIPLSSLIRTAADDEVTAAVPSLQIVSAEFEADMVVVSTGSAVGRLDCVWIETLGQNHPLVPQVSALVPLGFRAPWEDGREHLDAAVIVHVEAASPEGDPLYGRAWLHRPEMIGLSSRTRTWRQALLIVERDGWGYGEDDYGALAELWCHVAQRIAQRQAMVRTPSSPGGHGPSPAVPAAPLDERESTLPLVVSISAMDDGITPYAANSPLALIRRAGETFRRLLTTQPDDALRREEGLDGEREDGDDTAPEEDVRPRSRAPRPISAEERRQAESADQQMFATIPAFFSTPASSEAVGEMADAVDLLLLALVQRYLRFRERLPFHARTVLQQLSEVVGRAFALDGAAYGEPRGWFVRAWLDPATGDAVREAFSDGDRVASIIYCIGILGIPPHPEAVSRTTLRSYLGGIEVVSGRLGPLTHPAHAETLGTYAEALEPDSEGRGSGVDVLRVLEEAARVELPLVVCAGIYEAVLKAEAGGPLPVGESRLHRLYRRLRERHHNAVAPVRVSGDTASCGRCGSRVPTSIATRLESMPGGALCDGCHLLLVPFDPANPRVHRIYAFFAGGAK